MLATNGDQACRAAFEGDALLIRRLLEPLSKAERVVLDPQGNTVGLPSSHTYTHHIAVDTHLIILSSRQQLKSLHYYREMRAL